VSAEGIQGEQTTTGWSSAIKGSVPALDEVIICYEMLFGDIRVPTERFLI
jgi:hypothetical protein